MKLLKTNFPNEKFWGFFNAEVKLLMDFEDTEGIQSINNHLTFLNALPECIQHKSSILKSWFIKSIS